MFFFFPHWKQNGKKPQSFRAENKTKHNDNGDGDNGQRTTNSKHTHRQFFIRLDVHKRFLWSKWWWLMMGKMGKKMEDFFLEKKMLKNSPIPMSFVVVVVVFSIRWLKFCFSIFGLFFQFSSPFKWNGIIKMTNEKKTNYK